MNGTGLRAILRAAAAALLAFLPPAARAEPAPGELVPVTMHIGFTPEVFFDANRDDVAAAFRVIGETVAQNMGFRLTVTVHFYGDARAFQAAMEAHQVNFAIFDASTFVSSPPPAFMTPVFVPSSKGATGTHYLLLVRADSGLRSVADLRSRKIVQLEKPNLVMGRAWLRSMVLAANAGSSGGFFRSVESVTRPTEAVLPVFFGSRDACVVDDLSFGLMSELNPQVGQRLRAIASSEPIVSFVICASESDWSAPKFRPELMKVLGNMDGNPGGRQILTLFNLDQLVPFKAQYLDSARSLLLAQVGAVKPAP